MHGDFSNPCRFRGTVAHFSRGLDNSLKRTHRNDPESRLGGQGREQDGQGQIPAGQIADHVGGPPPGPEKGQESLPRCWKRIRVKRQKSASAVVERSLHWAEAYCTYAEVLGR